MKLKRISIIIEIGYVLLAPLFLVGVMNSISVFTNNQTSIYNKILIPLVFVFLIVGFFALVKYLVQNNLKVGFDKSRVIFGESSVELKHITSLKMTTTHFLNRYKLKVTYIDGEGQENAFTFFPRFLYENLMEFIKLVETENPKADLQKIFKRPFLIEKNKN